jgi:hypothetical protein
LRYPLIAVWTVVFAFSALVMAVPITMLTVPVPPDTSTAERIPMAFGQSVRGEMPLVATLLCTINAFSQYGFRHTARRIVEGDDPNPTRGFRWMRALQSVVTAWVLWYATLIGHCLM